MFILPNIYFTELYSNPNTNFTRQILRMMDFRSYSISRITPQGTKSELLTPHCNFAQNFHPPFIPVKVGAKMQEHLIKEESLWSKAAWIGIKLFPGTRQSYFEHVGHCCQDVDQIVP